MTAACVAVARSVRRRCTRRRSAPRTSARRSSWACSSTTRFFAFFSLLVISSNAQVDENGKITRVRAECPSETCGAGAFMATHFDRHTCGKCYRTVSIEKPAGSTIKGSKKK